MTPGIRRGRRRDWRSVVSALAAAVVVPVALGAMNPTSVSETALKLTNSVESRPVPITTTTTTTAAPQPAVARASRSATPAETKAGIERRMAKAVFARLNQERVAQGLAPMVWSDDLTPPAERWSAYMANNDYFEHRDLSALMENRNPELRGMGENIYMSSGEKSSGGIHVAWMESPGHKANILKPGFDRVGIGIHCAADGSVWATQEFGTTMNYEVPARTAAKPLASASAVVDDDLTCKG